MDLKHQLLFFFSGLGAFNGLLMSAYFAFFAKHRNQSNYFLAALLFVISIRIAKSVFKFFSPNISELFIQVGLSACILIGPFLYFYTKAIGKEVKITTRDWVFHVTPFVLLMIVLGFSYPYYENQVTWSRYLVRGIYLQWLIYIILSWAQTGSTLKKLFSTPRKLDDLEIWLVSVMAGVSMIWMAHSTTFYTSYIAGALSFSFVFYLLLLLWIFKRKNKMDFLQEPVAKYGNKRIKTEEARNISVSLDELLQEKQLYQNANLKLQDVARELRISPHQLSQFLNDNLGKSFNYFINEYRVRAAKQLLAVDNKLTTEAIGYECGFNSKSTFFTTFKKMTGSTPSGYRSTLSSHNGHSG